MKKGDIVTVFEDQMTEMVPEGKAILIERQWKTSETEQWLVEFLDERGIAYPYNIYIGEGSYNLNTEDE